MKNLPFFVFFILLIAIIAVNSVQIKPFFTKTSKTQELDKASKIELPVSLDNRNVNNVYLAYTFLGPIKEIKKVSPIEIILETSEKNLPQFVITQEDTKIFRVGQDTNITSADIDDLKEGLHVSISTTYDLKTHLWLTRTIHIVH